MLLYFKFAFHLINFFAEDAYKTQKQLSQVKVCFVYFNLITVSLRKVETLSNHERTSQNKYKYKYKNIFFKVLFDSARQVKLEQIFR